MNILNNKELIMVIFIIVIIAVNWALFSAFKRNRTGDSINILKNTLETAKNPFKQENQQLDELSQRVKDLESKIDISQTDQKEENV